MSERKPLVRHTGVVASVLENNIDTDQIIPSREMNTVSKDGLGIGLFAGQRYLSTDSREKNPAFVLNQPEYKQTSILLSGKNFGCGSSREHAVWALYDFGIRVILAQSFGEIFQGNCARNGILAICLQPDVLTQISTYSRANPGKNQLTVDLENQIVFGNSEYDLKSSFDIDPFQRTLLLGGLDPIGLTLNKQDTINAFLELDKTHRPWVYANG